MRTLGVFVFAVVAMGCSRVETQPRPIVVPGSAAVELLTVASVDALLNAHEAPHADPAAWRRLEAGRARAHLVAVLTNPAEGASRQARAAESLGFLAQVEEIALLERTAAAPSLHRLVRMGALTGLHGARGAASAGLLASYLNDPEPGVRARAVDLLGALATPEAKAALATLAKNGSAADRARVTSALLKMSP